MRLSYLQELSAEKSVAAAIVEKEEWIEAIFLIVTTENPSVRLLLAEKHVDLIRSASGRKSFGVGIFKRARHKPRFLSGPLNVNSAIHWKRGEVFLWTQERF